MNELYYKLLNRAISDHPETAAELLGPHIKSLQEEREHLLLRILQHPLTFNSMVELVHTLANKDIPLDQREELFKRIMSVPVSEEMLREIIDAYESGNLTYEQRRFLLSGILSQLSSEEILYIPEVLKNCPLVQEQLEEFARMAFDTSAHPDTDLDSLFQSLPLTTEQRFKMIGVLLSDNTAEDLVRVGHDHWEYLKSTQRDKLWEILLSYSPDKERRKQLMEFLLGYNLEKEQRAELWNKLLESSPDNEHRQRVVDLLNKCNLEKEQRTKLWDKLLESSLDNEHRQRIVDLLDKCNPEKEQRVRLWNKLLESSPESERRQWVVDLLDQCNLEKEQRIRLWNKLLESSPDNEQGLRILDLLNKYTLKRAQQEKIWDVILNYPPEKKHRSRMIDILGQYPMDKEQRECLWNILSEYPSSPEQVSRFSKPLFTFISKGSLPSDYQNMQTIGEYRRLYKLLYSWVNPDTERWKQGHASAYERIIENKIPVSEVLLDMICEENICYLKNADIEFIDRKQLWLMIEELLLKEEYDFPIKKPSPRIIDCGVNIGLAIYYMKQRWPDARITGFEPWDIAYECALRNIKRNHWENVDLHHSALSAMAGTQELTVVRENSTAATLTNRMNKQLAEEKISSVSQTVQTEQLSSFLTEPVDLLKMDIEGMEQRVLEEAKGGLTNVRYLFCEYHYSQDDDQNSLARILTQLESAGFAFQIERSLAYQQRQSHIGNYLGRNSSTCIWASNMNYENQAEGKDS